MRRAGIAVILLAALSSPSAAQTVTAVETEGAVTAIVQTPRGSYAETERGTLRIEPGDCDGGICLSPGVIRGLPVRAPDGALPDGFVATAPAGDIVRAWYGQPTDRYAHGVLGDAIEGGSLAAETLDGNAVEFVLPEQQVFEDITPRIRDLDGDGTNEVITIRASQSGGAAVVIYGLRAGELVEITSSSENGRPNRWLNIAAIVPAGTGEGGSTIVGVRTPHIGGRLFTVTMAADGSVTERNDIARNLSNHLIGSRELGLSAVLDGRLYIPSQDRRSLRAPLSDAADIALPAPIDKAIIAVAGRLITATQDGQLLVIEP
ncbi:MAG: hypothetical protein JJ920_11110 [Roseitalea sp.]|jgi:hypothetical protein|nr:hypothetical protein [Roseitalea sp.]MBO6722014.1 hypothetical protein [Roseitalea sp.]MBO6743452.1 hypothetical protein [Roseitalea sp.]